jgi:hypothetical protein
MNHKPPAECLRHPSIDLARMEIRTIYGAAGRAVPVTCPGCGSERWYPVRTLEKWARTPDFTGRCKPCATPIMRASWEALLRRKPRAAIHLTGGGYRAVPQHAVPDEHQWIWKKLRNKGNTVLEHRLVYSIALGRPLHSNECVDHMNGDRLDNRLENLRLYLKGANQPGSCPGGGTYYDEWQQAEARIRVLEQRVKDLTPA